MSQETLDQIQIAEDWERRGFSCSMWVDPPGQVWKNYVHDTDELLLVLTGDVDVEMQGCCMRAKAGEEILIPAGVPHTVRNVGDAPSEWLYGYRRG